jgi:hypothetical protein
MLSGTTNNCTRASCGDGEHGEVLDSADLFDVKALFSLTTNIAASACL